MAISIKKSIEFLFDLIIPGSGLGKIRARTNYSGKNVSNKKLHNLQTGFSIAVCVAFILTMIALLVFPPTNLGLVFNIAAITLVYAPNIFNLFTKYAQKFIDSIRGYYHPDIKNDLQNHGHYNIFHHENNDSVNAREADVMKALYRAKKAITAKPEGCFGIFLSSEQYKEHQSLKIALSKFSIFGRFNDNGSVKTQLKDSEANTIVDRVLMPTGL